MERLLFAVVSALVLALGGCASLPAPTPEARAALAPAGKLRVGLYTGNPLSAVRDASSGELRGMGHELGGELARALGVPFEPVVHPSVGALLEAGAAGRWDVAFFIATPERTATFDFAAPLVELELGYLVPGDSPLKNAAEADRAGIRIAVSAKGQADVLLTRSLKQATLVRAPGLAAVLERVRTGNADAVAANKAILHELAPQLAGSRILEGRFAAEQVALALPKGREAGVRYARAFVAGAKGRGLVQGAMDRAGVRGAVVARATE